MLVSYLSARKIQLPFRNAEELLSKTEYRLNIIYDSAHEDFFINNPEPLFKRIHSQRILPFKTEYKHLNSVQNSVKQLIKEENLAFYGSSGVLRNTKAYENCKIVLAPAKYHLVDFAFGFQKNSPFIDIFNHNIQKMKEKGSLNRILEKYGRRKQKCPDYSGKPLSMKACFSSFFVVILGLVLGFSIFSLEKLHIIKSNSTTDYLTPEQMSKESQIEKLNFRIKVLEEQLKFRDKNITDL